MIGFTQRPTKRLRAASIVISCVLAFTGLFGGVNFAHAAALTSTSVTPASLVAGASSTATIAFTTFTTVPANGKIKVTFPSGFNISGSVPVSCPTMDGTVVFGVSGQVLTITRQNDGTAQTAAAESCTLGAVINPQVSGTTGTFTIQTTDSSDVELDVNAAVAGVTITAGVLTSTNVEPATLVAGASGTTTVSFTTANPIPSDGKIKVTFGSGYNVSGAAGASCSGTMDGSYATSVSGQVVTITRSAGTSQSAAAETCTIGTIVNPGVSGSTGTYTITTTNSSDVTIDTLASVTADTITAGVLSSANVQPSNLVLATTNTNTVSFTTANAIPSDGKIIVTFGSGFSLTSVVSTDATCSTMDGTFTASVSGQVVTITRATGTSQTAAAETCTIAHVRNPLSTGSTGTYTITTANSSTVTIDTLTSVSADIIIAESSSSTPVELTYDISVSAPVVSAAYNAGDTISIAWSTAESTGSVGGIDLSYSTDGGVTYTEIVTGTGNDGSYSWTAPDITATSVIVRAQATDLVDVLATDVSDAFSITGTSTSDESEDTSDDTTTDDSSDDSSDESSDDSTGDLPAGSFFRGTTSSTVYYVDSSGDRRPFLNSSTFFTYTDSFDDVEMISDESINEYTLGSAMLPQSGVVLVKIQSLNNVYAVEDVDGVQTLRWITSEDVAVDLYGSAWADYVVDIDATLWPHLTFGSDVESASDLDVDTGDLKTRAELAAM